MILNSTHRFAIYSAAGLFTLLCSESFGQQFKQALYVGPQPQAMAYGTATYVPAQQVPQ